MSAETRDTFRNVLSVDDATWARGRGWALSQAVMALSYYTLETNSALVLEAQRWMAEVLADHAPTYSLSYLHRSVSCAPGLSQFHHSATRKTRGAGRCAAQPVPVISARRFSARIAG